MKRAEVFISDQCCAAAVHRVVRRKFHDTASALVPATIDSNYSMTPKRIFKIRTIVKTKWNCYVN